MSDVSSQGEILERRRQRRKTAVYFGLFAVGLASGIAIGAREADDLFTLDRPWPPLLCLGIAAAFLAAVIAGNIALSRQMDEVERAAQRQATAVAAMTYAIGYPIWFLLWKGGFAPEPMHVALFAVFILVTIGASIFYKFR